MQHVGRPMALNLTEIDSQKSEHDSRRVISSATTLSMDFIALDEACEQEVFHQNAHRVTRPCPLHDIGHIHDIGLKGPLPHDRWIRHTGICTHSVRPYSY